MPSRIFDQLDLIGVSEGYIIGPTGTSVPVVTSVSFGNIHIDGTDSSVNPLGASVNNRLLYRQNATVDLTNFPAVPITSRITELKVRTPKSVNILAHAIGDGVHNNDVNIIFLSPNPIISLVTPFGIGRLADISFSHVESETALQSEVTYTFSPSLTYADFNSLYAAVSLDISIHLTSSAYGTADFTYTISYDGGWQFEVTYVETFSWYLNTHQETIGGINSTVVDSTVQVFDGDTPPVGSTFYGTGVDFPTQADIPLYNWYNSSGNVWLFQTQAITPGVGWTLTMPDIDFTGDIAAVFATEALFVYMLKPSGIYTLTANKRHDTLYERLGAITTIDVAIPEPFIKTAYMSDEDIE